MKRRYLIVDLVNKVVFGTDNRKDAKGYIDYDTCIVVDAETGLVMKGGGEDNYSVLSLEDGQPETGELKEYTFHLIGEEKPRTIRWSEPSDDPLDGSLDGPFDDLEGEYGSLK